ncbi:sugar ABC transporter substrate-binding protein [Caldanaerobius polysaccharolyticus]|uniref:sugar ABC transporter substrate-binding protein n=1 Tax=Caldanaerobius polysaccharolyticus TaxID=44256 RepID=UPI000478E36F|nr:sugar ABC transporter substrate-binding protein [Caldanaerobius polysaccharolyticus]
MKKVKKLLTILLTIFLVAILFVGCNSSKSSQTSKSNTKKHYKFGYTCMTMNNPFFQVIAKTMKSEIEKNGDELIITDPAMDVSKQINQIEDMIAQGIDAILLNPVDWEGIRPALVELKRAGIPIINFDTEVKDFNYVTAYVGSDNKNAGKVCGEDLVKRFPKGGKIAILDSPTMNSINDRIAGFMSAIKGKGFTIVAQQDAKGDLQTAMQLTEDILQAHPDIVAIMGGNDPTALGALAAAKAAHRTDILIYGVDGSPDAKSEIAKGGQFVGSGAQSPKQIAIKSVEVAYKILKGEPYQKRTPVPTFLINKDNVDKYGITGWQ